MSDEIPVWATKEAFHLVDKETGWKGWVGDVRDWEKAFARYISTHQDKPVDEDVLAVRAVLASQWESQASEDILAGREDNASYFQDALAAYRKHKQ